ncbi:MAG TPA: hypothetical protein VLT16_08195 [Candidatus Limnocylindrales bacterium]|nr:hypothetical protein [Candidatus Limnocylindrales bacterium]
MKRGLSLLALAMTLCIAASGWAQDSNTSRFKGFNAYETFQGTASSSSTLLKLDSSVGYDFNEHFGLFAGVPLYFANDRTARGNAAPLTSDGGGAGDFYFGMDLYAPNPYLDYSSSVTVSAPTGSVSKGFSTGRRTVDWTNRLRRHFGKFAPYVALGLSNTVPDTDLLTRAFTSLGNIGHFEEGADYDLTRRVYLGASAYQIVPFGNQQVFNRVNPADSGPGPGGGDNQNPPAAQPPPAQPSASGADLTRENGFDTWLGFEPSRLVRLEAGYSRSITFALNRVSFNVGLNLGRMLRGRKTH